MTNKQAPQEMKCRHEPNYLEKIETLLTPSVGNPATNTIAQVIFHCKRCGALIAKHIEVARPYAANGTVFPEVLGVLNQIAEQQKAMAEMNKLQDQAQAAGQTVPAGHPDDAALTN